MDNDNTVSKYDRMRGAEEGIALFTKPTTIASHEVVTGKAETYIVQTCRRDEYGDTIFVQCMDSNGVTRLALPPRVARAIARQRDALTSKMRSRRSKEIAQAMKDRGEVPGFLRKHG